MKTLIIYDNEGYIISTRQGQPSPRVPVGVPYLYVEISEGKEMYVDEEGRGVDVTVEPHELLLRDIPPTQQEIQQQEINSIREENLTLRNDLDNAIIELTMAMFMQGGM